MGVAGGRLGVLCSSGYHKDRRDAPAKAGLHEIGIGISCSDPYIMLLRTIRIIRIWRFHVRWDVKFWRSLK
jgi:hypothetical protein